MNIKSPKLTISLVIIIFMGLFTACKNDRETNKIIDGQPLAITNKVFPGEATQQLILLRRDSLSIIVPIVNRLALTNVNFNELIPVGGGTYQFTFSDNRYGVATFSVNFFDANGAKIDPIALQTSSSTLKTVVLTTAGQSTLFQYSETITLTLEIAGNFDSTKTITGTSNFQGQGYTITFSYPSPGLPTNSDGLIGGVFGGTGSGPNASPTSLAMIYATDHSCDGSITWESYSGGIRFNNNGLGTIITDVIRILID